MPTTTKPDRSEAAEYYFTYIDQVPPGDIRDVLAQQSAQVVALLEGVSEQQSLHRYAADKWSLRQVMSHVNDTERVFAHRMLWFGRGFDTPLASFDQNIAMAASSADARTWASHVEEFRAVRHATLTLARSFEDDAWRRHGVASGHTVSVRALAFIAAGHVAHHMHIVRERYL